MVHRADLFRLLAASSGDPLLRIEGAVRFISIRTFHPEQFAVPSAEELLSVHRARTGAFPSTGDFLFHSLLATLEIPTREQMAALLGELSLEPLSLEEWWAFADEHCSGLRVPVPEIREVLGGFIAAFQLTHEWNDRSAFLVTTEEMKAVYWSTTA